MPITFFPLFFSLGMGGSALSPRCVPRRPSSQPGGAGKEASSQIHQDQTGGGCGIAFTFEFPKHLSPVPAGRRSTRPAGLRVPPGGLQHPSPAAPWTPPDPFFPPQATNHELSGSFPAGNPRSAPVPAATASPGDAGAGRGLLVSSPLPRELPEPPGPGTGTRGRFRSGIVGAIPQADSPGFSLCFSRRW